MAARSRSSFIRPIRSDYYHIVVLVLALLLLQPANQTPAQPDPPVEIEEHVVVTATRSDRRIQDEPLRVEVIDREEIEEKALMTPGSVAMLLSETTGSARADHGALDWRRQRADSRAARPLRATARGRVAAVRRRRLVQPAASPTARSRAGRSDQGRRLRALRSRSTGRRDQPGIAPAARIRTGSAVERHLAAGGGRHLLARASAAAWLVVDVAQRIPRTAAAGSR